MADDPTWLKAQLLCLSQTHTASSTAQSLGGSWCPRATCLHCAGTPVEEVCSNKQKEYKHHPEDPNSRDCCSYHGVSFLLSFFQPFLNSTTGAPGFCPLVGYLHLALSAACWDSWRAAMLGSSLQAHHSTSNSLRPQGLPLSWIPM